jgi:hypothetical protein
MSYATRLAAGMAAVLLMTAACKKGSTTAPTTTTTTTTTAADLINDTFSGTLGVGGTVFFPFTVVQGGSVTVGLNSIGGAGVPSTVQVRLGIGTQDDTGCNATVIGLANSAQPTLTATEGAGAFCANVTDVGNLFAPADFTITVTHP